MPSAPHPGIGRGQEWAATLACSPRGLHIPACCCRIPSCPSQPFLLVFSLPGMVQVPRAVGPGCLQQGDRQGARASPSLVPELGFCLCQGASQQHHAVVLWLGLDPDPTCHLPLSAWAVLRSQVVDPSHGSGRCIHCGVGGGIQSRKHLSVCDTAHLGAHLAIRDPSSELPHAWGCPGMPSWNQEGFEPWQTEGQSRLAWRKLRVYGLWSILGGGREQLGQWARELCCAGLNVTSVSPDLAGGCTS